MYAFGPKFCLLLPSWNYNNLLYVLPTTFLYPGIKGVTGYLKNNFALSSNNLQNKASNQCNLFQEMVVGEAEFFSSSSFMEFQTVKFRYVSSWNFARVFRVSA